MIAVIDPEINVRVGFFQQGRFVKDPDIDGPIGSIQESISEHEAAIKKMEQLKCLCEHLKKFREKQEEDFH